MRQIMESLPPVFEMLIFVLFIMLLFSMLGECFFITILHICCSCYLQISIFWLTELWI